MLYYSILPTFTGTCLLITIVIDVLSSIYIRYQWYCCFNCRNRITKGSLILISLAVAVFLLEGFDISNLRNDSDRLLRKLVKSLKKNFKMRMLVFNFLSLRKPITFSAKKLQCLCTSEYLLDHYYCAVYQKFLRKFDVFLSFFTQQ